jgi:PIN domain nuclease of toxin-antitoxin system
VTLLLDTHAFFWAVNQPDRLSITARDLISDASVPLLVSAASAWEMSMKHRLGRWPQVADTVRNFDRKVQRLGANCLSISVEHALAAGSLEWDHKDPFDRALAAQAMREGAQLVSKDRAFSGLPGLSLVW